MITILENVSPLLELGSWLTLEEFEEVGQEKTQNAVGSLLGAIVVMHKKAKRLGENYNILETHQAIMTRTLTEMWTIEATGMSDGYWALRGEKCPSYTLGKNIVTQCPCTEVCWLGGQT